MFSHLLDCITYEFQFFIRDEIVEVDACPTLFEHMIATNRELAKISGNLIVLFHEAKETMAIRSSALFSSREVKLRNKKSSRNMIDELSS